MEEILDFLRTDTFLIIIIGITLLLLIGYITNIIKLNKLNKSYKKFLSKLGNGNNVEEVLKKYIDRVEEVNEKNKELITYCNRLNKDISKCVQKIGIVRYSAFKDIGSDLSFALALLDENDNGVVLNGIYSREMSNIYAKPVEKGKSTYTISEEEKQAIDIAVKSERTHIIKE